MAWRRGDQIGPWRLVAWLGSGGHADVWRAEGPPELVVALKILRNFNRRHVAYRRFRDEVAILRRLGSASGILRLIDASVPEQPTRRDPAWLAMPEAVGIRDALGPGPELRSVVSAVAEITLTLAGLASRHSVHHRDIKPANLYRLDEGWLVGDFGLVAFPGKEELTRSAEKLGPLGFLAPEMLTNPETADAEPADVYALAKTLWVLGCGEKWPPPGPIAATDPDVRLSDRVNTRRARLLDPVLERATKYRPETRPSLAELHAELTAWLAPPRELRGAPPEDEVLLRRIARIQDPQRATADERATFLRSMSASLDKLKQQLSETNNALSRYRLQTAFSSSEVVFQEIGIAANPGAYRLGWEARAFGDTDRTDGRGPLELIAAVGIEDVGDGRVRVVVAHGIGENQLGRESLWSQEATVIPGTAAEDAAIARLGRELNERLAVSLAEFADRLEARFPPPIMRDCLAAAAASDAWIYLMGGQALPAGGAVAVVEAFAPPSGEWRQCANMPTARLQPRAAALGTGVIVVGGHTADFGHLNVVERLDAETGEWETLAPLSTPRSEAACAATGEVIVSAGGFSAHGETAIAEAYNAESDRWEALEPLPVARRGNEVIAANDGLLYSIGGWTQGGPIADVHAFDLRTATWTARAPMPTPRAFHAAALGGDGRIYVAGGFNSGDLTTIEAYDPMSDVWHQHGELRRARSNIAAEGGRDGRVFVFGGRVPETEIAELIFDPGTSGQVLH